MALSVGRRKSKVSTSGRSRPSLKRSAAKSTLTRRAFRSVRLAHALGARVEPLTASAGTPASLNTLAMNSACATLTQKPRAPMAPGRAPCLGAGSTRWLLGLVAV